jgi:hypothetical protein
MPLSRCIPRFGAHHIAETLGITPNEISPAKFFPTSDYSVHRSCVIRTGLYYDSTGQSSGELAAARRTLLCFCLDHPGAYPGRVSHRATEEMTLLLEPQTLEILTLISLKEQIDLATSSSSRQPRDAYIWKLTSAMLTHEIANLNLLPYFVLSLALLKYAIC